MAVLDDAMLGDLMASIAGEGAASSSRIGAGWAHGVAALGGGKDAYEKGQLTGATLAEKMAMAEKARQEALIAASRVGARGQLNQGLDPTKDNTNILMELGNESMNPENYRKANSEVDRQMYLGNAAAATNAHDRNMWLSIAEGKPNNANAVEGSYNIDKSADPGAPGSILPTSLTNSEIGLHDAQGREATALGDLHHTQNTRIQQGLPMDGSRPVKDVSPRGIIEEEATKGELHQVELNYSDAVKAATTQAQRASAWDNYQKAKNKIIARSGLGDHSEAVAAPADVGRGRTDRAAAPSVGTVSKGYRFNGGDPSNPASWTKI